MADPVTMAIGGAAAGALMNKDDPLKGAALGGIGGFAGGSMLPGLMGAQGGIGAAEAGLGTITNPSLAMHQAAMAGGGMPLLAGPLGAMGGYSAAPGMSAIGTAGLPMSTMTPAGLMAAEATPVSGLGVANGGNSAMDMLKYGKMLMPNQQQQPMRSGSAPAHRASAGGGAFSPYGPQGSAPGMPRHTAGMVFGR